MIYTLLGLGALAAVCYALLLQIAFVNVGQEFGAYGHYHRVLHLIERMEGLEVVGSRVRRELEWDHLFHVEEFEVTVMHGDGARINLLFRKDTPEMEETDAEALKAIVLEKLASP